MYVSVQHCVTRPLQTEIPHTETQVIPDSINNFYSGKIAGGAHWSLTNDKGKWRLYRHNQKEIAVGKKGISCMASGIQSSTSENNVLLCLRKRKTRITKPIIFDVLRNHFPLCSIPILLFNRIDEQQWTELSPESVNSALFWLCNTDSCSLRYLCLSKWKHVHVHTQLIQYNEKRI